MKKGLCPGVCRAVVVPLALIAAFLSGCRSAGFVEGAAQDRASLTAQAERWDQAIVQKDRVRIEANLAPDFRQIDGRGNVEAKKSFVDGLMDLKLEIDPYAVEEFEIRLYGDVALLSGRTRMTGRYEGKPFQSHYRYIDVYVRRTDGWKVVSVQISKLPD